MRLEDAKIFEKDMYALNVDITSAFNTKDHNRMLWIMYDLGFPADAIDAVKNFMETQPHESGSNNIQITFRIHSENTG